VSCHETYEARIAQGLQARELHGNLVYNQERSILWQSRKWRVAVADDPRDGHIENCHTYIGALYTALVYRVAGWRTQIFKAGSASLEKVLGDLKCSVWLKIK
jgi:hypothetical protein